MLNQVQHDVVITNRELLRIQKATNMVYSIVVNATVRGYFVRMRKKSDRSIIGEKLKAIREQAGLSMRELASRSGISVSLISKIEAGTVCPTVLSLQRIVESMGMEMYEFFLDQFSGDPASCILFKKKDMVVSEDEEHSWNFAFPKHPDIKAQLAYEEYAPHSRVEERTIHKGDVFGYVISGELTLEVNGLGTFKAEAGDAYYIKAGLPHSPKNEDDEVLRQVSVQLRE